MSYAASLSGLICAQTRNPGENRTTGTLFALRTLVPRNPGLNDAIPLGLSGRFSAPSDTELLVVGLADSSRQALRFLQLVQLRLNFCPMGAVPKEFAAATANEILIQPAISSWWNALAHLLFIHLLELATAVHAARLPSRQPQLLEHHLQLFQHGERRRHPNGRDDAIPQNPSFHQNAVRGDQSGGKPPRLAQQILIIDVGNPARFVARDTEPAGQATEAGIAEK